MKKIFSMKNKENIKRRFQYKVIRSKQIWICLHLLFHTKKLKKKNLKSEKIFSMKNKENIKRRFQYKVIRSKQIWICLHLLFHTKKVKKKNLKSEKIFSMKSKEKYQEKIPIQNDTFQTNLNLLTLTFPYKKS